MTRLQFLEGAAKYYQYLVRLAFSYGSRHPQDVVQHIIMRLLDGHKYGEAAPDAIRPWLARVVINQTVDEYRRQRVHEGMFMPIDSVPVSRAVGLDAETMEASADIREAIATLEPLDQQIALGVYMGNETFDSMGELTGYTGQYLRVRAMSIKRHLRDFLKDYKPLSVGKPGTTSGPSQT